MKSIFMLLVTLVIGLAVKNCFAATTVTLDGLTKIVSERNFTVLAEAEKSYQAKLNIDQARNNLLPKLNIWGLAKVVIDPVALLDVITDVAPFLVPSNWFRLKETEILYYVEKEGYRALWANELGISRTLYLKILMDNGLYDIVKEHLADLKKIHEIAQVRHTAGLEKIETVRSLEIQVLKLEDDEAQLKRLAEEELSVLSLSLGFSAEEAIDIEPIALARPSDQKNIDYRTYVLKVLDVAPELRQYDHFLKVIPYLKKEAEFSFLGASETSRGVAGGIFDDISISSGLGFSTATTIKIIDSQKKILEIQQQGISETIKGQLKGVVGVYNSIINFYIKTEKREALAIENIETLNQKLLFGEKIDLLTMADALETRTLSRAAKLEQLYRFRLNQDRLLRLIFDNEYAKLPATLERIKK
ncbi:MAG: hypothetical protein A2Z20_11290 [Bdellovibrionales bacterium RBG_16_40_8]|nr:MAG: hypothetical protein A2Z20_11290 [Bdellovibrionales bacterium RBG_16_40_8]